MFFVSPRPLLRGQRAPLALMRQIPPQRPNRWLAVLIVLGMVLAALVVAVRLGARLDVGWNVSFYQPTQHNPSDNKSCEPPTAGQCR